jgi:hypothetical protein
MNKSGPWYAQDFATAPYRPTLPQPSRNRRRKLIMIVAAVLAILIATVAGVVGSGGGSAPVTGFIPSGSSPGQDAEQITGAFLAAWKQGDLVQAARYTDHPSAAESALLTYRKYLLVKRVTGTVLSVGASATRGESVTFEMEATVTAMQGAKTRTGAWTYRSSLVAYQQRDSQVWYIAWSPDVLAPNLTATTHLAAVLAPPQVVAVTDSSGNDLTSYGDAGLSNIASLLEKQGRGSPGLYVEIQTVAGKTVAGSQAVVIAPHNVPSVATTIDAKAEAAARSAVAKYKGSSMVAIQPSTGKILAIANNDGYNDFALTAAVAPGSTGKIISATALLADHVLTANSGVSCPATYTVQGITYHNDNNETEPASASFTTDFAQSCNNAFDQWWPELTGGRLAAAARRYYGLNQPWDLGIGQSATYYDTPPARQITATPLPASTDAGLKQMMRAVVTTGTAAGLGFGPGVYAKTGTADINNQGQPNSWFVAFDPGQDVAVACLVLNAGTAPSSPLPRHGTL